MLTEFLKKDIPQLTELKPENWPDLTGTFNYYTSSPHCFPLKYVINNEIIGTGTVIIFHQTAWLAHIIVKTKYRNKGYGQKIVRYLLDYLGGTNVKTISLIATDLGFPVYKKAGFKVIGEYAFFKQAYKIKRPLDQNISGIGDEMFDEILKMDEEITGEKRKSLLSEHLAGGFVYLDGKKILGYYLPTAGEGPIMSKDKKAGMELLNFKSSTGRVKGVLPVDNLAGMEYYENHGFTETHRVKRMELGDPLVWKAEHIFGRMGGNVG